MFSNLPFDKSLEVFINLGAYYMPENYNVNQDNTSIFQNINSIANTAERISDASSNRETLEAIF